MASIRGKIINPVTTSGRVISEIEAPVNIRLDVDMKYQSSSTSTFLETERALFLPTDLSNINNIFLLSKPEKFGNEIHQSVINGAVAGWSVWTVTYPIETIKVEQQVCNKPVLYILKKRISNFGVLNLWKGILPVYLRTLPSSIIGMTVYEQARKFIE